jgi:hypothetical protein
VLFILYNLSLIYLIYKFFEYLRPNLYPCFIYVIQEINVTLSPQISDSILYIRNINDIILAHRHGDNFRNLAEHSLREYDKAQNAANNLFNIAPITLREGRVGLHHSFIDSAKRLQAQADMLWDDYTFFMRQKDYIMDWLW